MGMFLSNGDVLSNSKKKKANLLGMVFKDWLFIGSELLKDPPLKILPAFLSLRDSWISLWRFLSPLSAKMHGREVLLLLAGAAVESRQGNLHICSSGQGASRGDGGALGNAE